MYIARRLAYHLSWTGRGAIRPALEKSLLLLVGSQALTTTLREEGIQPLGTEIVGYHTGLQSMQAICEAQSENCLRQNIYEAQSDKCLRPNIGVSFASKAVFQPARQNQAKHSPAAEPPRTSHALSASLFSRADLKLPTCHSTPGTLRGFASAAYEDPVEDFNKELSTLFGEPAARDNFTTTQDSGRRKDPEAERERRSPLEPVPPGLTHVDSSGRASMVDVSQKAETSRVAVASAKVHLGREAFELVAKNQIAKGDVLTVAQIAGINGAKQTANLIPLCHNLLLSRVKVLFSLDHEEHNVEVRAEVKTTGPTGVEMEALTAASVASLTIYDMCKAVSKSITIKEIRLEKKSGGKSGDWARHAG